METWLLLVVVFIAVMLVLFVLILAPVYKANGLSDAGQALGLPDGSVRAVIALALIALFAVTPLVLFNGLAGSERVVARLSADDMKLFIDKNQQFAPIWSEQQPDKTYTVHYQAKPGDGALDFAKQLLNLISILATAVTSFYFGAKIAGSASAQGALQAGTPAAPPPALAVKGFSTDPAPVVRKGDGSVDFALHLSGANMNAIQWIKLTAGSGNSLETSKFAAKSNDLEATAQVLFKPGSAQGAQWSISALNSSGAELATLTDQITF